MNFVVGIFYGMFILDLIQCTSFIHKLKKFTKESKIAISYEQLKLEISQTKKLKKEEFVTKNQNFISFVNQANERANELVGHLIYKEYQSKKSDKK